MVLEPTFRGGEVKRDTTCLSHMASQEGGAIEAATCLSHMVAQEATSQGCKVKGAAKSLRVRQASRHNTEPTSH
jgi:hypothetical protein